MTCSNRSVESEEELRGRGTERCVEGSEKGKRRREGEARGMARGL